MSCTLGLFLNLFDEKRNDSGCGSIETIFSYPIYNALLTDYPVFVPLSINILELFLYFKNNSEYMSFGVGESLILLNCIVNYPI
jgi:hypothetical protein